MSRRKRFPENYHKEACSLLSKLVNRDEEKCTTIIEAGLSHAMGGHMAPAAHVIIRSITMEPSMVNEYSSTITEFLQSMLEIPGDRILINFYVSDPKLLARNGKALA